MNDAKIIELISNDDIKIHFNHFRVPETEFEEAVNKPSRKHKSYLERYSRKRGFGVSSRSNYRGIRPATKGGHTSCIISIRRKTFSGTGRCSLEDTFCYAIGRQYAFDRAFKKFTKYLIEQEDLFA